MRSKILPEKMYEFKNLSMENLKDAFVSNSTITVYVESSSAKSEELIVRLNDSIFGKIPFSEATIYPLTFSPNPNRDLPKELGYLMHKNIRAKIISINEETGEILLSRKKNMEEAYLHLKECTCTTLHVTSATTSAAFGDIGDGILGRLGIKQVSISPLRNISERIHTGECIYVKLLNSDDTKRFQLSYKATFPEYNPDEYTSGDSVLGTISEPIDESHTGYFVEVTPQVKGILYVKSWDPLFKYGDKVYCQVKSAKARGLSLKFSGFKK